MRAWRPGRRTLPESRRQSSRQCSSTSGAWVESDVIEAHKAVGQRRGISVNTVGSALERLHKKRLATRVKVSHAYRYSAVLDRETYRARRLAEAAGGVRALASAGLLAAFVDLVADADSAALDRLEDLIAEKRAEDGR